MNVVVDSLSRKEIHVSMMMIKHMELLEQFREISLYVDVSLGKLSFRMITISSDLMSEIKEKQLLDEQWTKKRDCIPLGKTPYFVVGSEDILRCKG